MNRNTAIEFLMKLGWNFYGAAAIVDTAIEDGIKLTEEKIKELHEDYIDR